MEVLIETCCGIDVHQKSIVCCILDGPLDTNKPKKIQKKFGTTTIALPNVFDCNLNLFEKEILNLIFCHYLSFTPRVGIKSAETELNMTIDIHF